jgi:hypothetical protein
VQLGASVNTLHAFAHSDDLGGTAGDFLETALDRGSLTRQGRLLIRMTMSSANQRRSYMAHLRCQLAGLAVAAKIAAISSPNSADLSAHERSAIRFVLATQPELRDVGLIPVGSLQPTRVCAQTKLAGRPRQTSNDADRAPGRRPQTVSPIRGASSHSGLV